MPTRIFNPVEPSPVPSLQELLAKVQAQTATQAPTLAQPQMGAVDGLSSMLQPYQGEGPTGMSQSPSFYQMAGMGSPMDLLGGGAPTMGGAMSYGAPAGGGYSTGQTTGGGAVPYSGPPSPTIEQWEANTQNGKLSMGDLREVPMTTAPLENRYAQSDGGWVSPNMPNVDTDVLMPLAARSYMDMAQAAAKDGVTLAFGQSYRSYPEQVAIAAEKGIYGQGGLAAVPGTSNHGEGLALDMNLSADPRMYDWLTQHGPDYGYYQPMSDEPWHWQMEGGYKPEYRYGQAGSGGPPASSAPRGPGAAAPRRKPPAQRPSSQQLRLMREGM